MATHGAELETVVPDGPEFPAEQETNTPTAAAPNAPTATAASMPARMSEPRHPSGQHTLYTATRAPGAIPRTVPVAYPSRLALTIAAPAAVDAVCMPCPSLSRADRNTLFPTPMAPPFAARSPREKLRAPTSFLPHMLGGKSTPASHTPFHRAGHGGRSPPAKLGDSGQTLVSRTPMTTSCVAASRL
uniref:Uncharacterized protein n=1 Tax=Arundo donax TaxID=35708 RepID=A0A0A9D9U5_ARUDO